MDIRQIHSEAMDFAEQATFARSRGEDLSAIKLLRKAFDRESKAALIAVSTDSPEPTRSVLLKSAAHLALECGELRAAEKLVSTALAGDPPEEVVDELRLLFEQIGFSRHLDVNGVTLESNEVQMVLLGNAIAPGMAQSDEFINRVDTVQSLIYRTSESDRKLEYRDRGDPLPQIEKSLKLFVSVPRAASFAVSLRVASDKQQGEFDFTGSMEVVTRLMDRLEMFENGDLASLRNAIQDPRYFENFMKSADSLAPDGTNVRLVGFTSIRFGKEKRLEMRHGKRGDNTVAFERSNDEFKVAGRIFFLNLKDEESPTIKLMEDDQTEWRLRADGALLQKAVNHAAKHNRVVVTGHRISKEVLRVLNLKTVPKQKTRKKKK